MGMMLLLTNLLFSANATEKIVVIDTGLNLQDDRFKHLCPDGHKDFTDTGLSDQIGHGTHIAGIIDKNIKSNYCIIIVKFYNGNETNTIKPFVNSLKYAISLNPSIINLSLSGSTFDKEEFEIFKNSKNVKFVVSAGNNGQELSWFTSIYPAQYAPKGVSNMIVVGALKDGKPAPYSNYGDTVAKWEDGSVESYGINGNTVKMSGTSQAAATYTYKLANGTK